MKTKTQQFQRLAEIAEHITVAFLLHFWPTFGYCGQDLVKMAASLARHNPVVARDPGGGQQQVSAARCERADIG